MSTSTSLSIHLKAFIAVHMSERDLQVPSTFASLPPCSSRMAPPRALRVLHLNDRLVLHDVTASLRGDPSDRNALIDAANAVHTRALSAVSAESPSLLDLSLPTPPSSIYPDRFLVLPFSAPSYEAASPDVAGVPLDLSATSVEAAAGLLGVLRLPSGRFAVLVTQVHRAGSLPSGPVYAAAKVKLIPLSSGPRDERELPAAVVKFLEAGTLYHSLHCDLTRATANSARRRTSDNPNAFWWTWPLAAALGDGSGWALRTVYGFVGTNVMRFASSVMPGGMGDFLLTVVSRRSRRRAGTRYITRGVDGMGDVANFVETEQVVWNEQRPRAYSSFQIVRGSVPVFWRQNNGIARPVPELDGTLTASRAAFAAHFRDISQSYGGVSAVSLVDKHGSESVLAEAFEKHFELDLRHEAGPFAAKLVAFDFHKHCSGKEYERGLALLMEQLKEDIELFGIHATGLESTRKNSSQMGVFRVNCVDCLDRTNVVQSMISRVVLNMQLKAVFSLELQGAAENEAPRLYAESEDRFKHVWGDNADAVSKQYSGTGALKTDFTRTGKRSTTGVIGDGVKSVMRMYYKNFVDEGRQEVIDVLCGNAVVRPPLPSSRANPEDIFTTDGAGTASSKDIWYSFEAIRVNASGDKQSVIIELHDESMYVTGNEGISLEYPRKSLLSWSKYEEGKPSDKKSTVRLRLLYRPSRSTPATTSPLDLYFKGGSTARENFLRAVVSWAQPVSASLLCKQDVRVRTLAALDAGEHRMQDWGLTDDTEVDEPEIVALILPEGNAITRSWGLAAVPMDVDESKYVLVSARSVSNRGPAIAILASKKAAPTVMNVSEAISGRAATFASGGAVAVALEACGTSLCFVGAKVSGAQDMYHTLTSLKLGRPSFDITNEYHHFIVAGLLGDMQWHHDSAPISGAASRKWVRLGDGSACYSLADGLSVMRNSFPGLRYEDRITGSSFWKDGNSKDSTTCIALSDGTVDGRQGPRLSESVSQCVISVSNLKGSDIKRPPGLDQNAQLNSLVALYCEYATVDGVATRNTSRPTAFPAWRETLNFVMIPSNPEEIYGSFIIGQIVVPTPLSEPVPAGHFVIPISCATNNSADFDVPCRLAGIPTGRVTGKLKVEFGGKDLLEKLGQLQLERKTTRGVKLEHVSNGSDPKGLSSLPRPTGSGDSYFRSNLDAVRKAKVPSFPSRLQKPTMEDMNKNLDAARKKGSKQIKSMVGKLSSLLNQPTSTPRRSQDQVSNLGQRARLGEEDEKFNEIYNEPQYDPRPSQQADRFRQPQGPLSSPTTAHQLGSHRSTLGSKTRHIPGSTSVPGRSASASPSLLDIDNNGESDFSGFQAAAPVRRGASTCSSLVVGGDALLNGLRASLSQTAKTSQGRKVPMHAHVASEDLLLSGLANEKRKAKDQESGNDADWGEFEQAQGSAGNGADGTKSLLDL